MFLKYLLLINIVFCEISNNDLPEGSKCMKDTEEGVCVNMFKCPQVIFERVHNIETKICSFDRLVPIVCCTSCSLVTNITDAVSGQLFWKTGSKAWDKCIEYSSRLHYSCKPDRVISQSWNDTGRCWELSHAAPFVSGGRSAHRAEYPHMALLGFGEDVKDAQWLCGGTIISESYVLTAAHCTGHPKLGPVSHIAAGILRRSDAEATWQRRTVASIIPHPEYRAPSRYHDIALLQADTRFSFSSQVLPACLPAPLLEEDRREYRQPLDATGWGALGKHRELADNLQVVTLEPVSVEACSALYPASRLLRRGIDFRTQVCYRDINHRNGDTCEGDSGGPLQYLSPSTCVPVVEGVTSFGAECDVSGGAGVYTTVQHYLHWIEGVVWK